MKKTAHKKPLTKARKIYNLISTVIIALVFIFLVLLVGVVLWQRASGKDSSLFGYYLFDVMTDSMEDTINAGDVILSKTPDDVNALQEGDIITFTAPSGVLAGQNETHRIYEIRRNADGTIDYIKTAGDNMYGGSEVRVDNWELNPTAVKAVYITNIPFLAGLRDFLSHWYGYVVLVALPLLIVGILFIIGFVKDKTAYELEKAGITNSDAAQNPPSLDNLSEEEKQKLLNDFLHTQSRNGDEQSSDASTDGIIQDFQSDSDISDISQDVDGVDCSDKDDANSEDDGDSDECEKKKF